MQDYVTPRFLAALKKNQWHVFETIWHTPIDWFEEPNQRRGGWSGVGRIQLEADGETDLDLFVKKQQDHGRRSWRHPFAGEPTFRREFQRLQFLENKAFAAPRVVFYGEASENSTSRAILITEALNGYQPLDAVLENWWKGASRLQRVTLLKKVAEGVRRFHSLGLMHRALYPKHIFVKDLDQNPTVALIDLEKARFTLFAWSRAWFDLAALNRHANILSKTQRMLFFKHYLSIRKLNYLSKFLCHSLIRRANR